mgnify:FL=1
MNTQTSLHQSNVTTENHLKIASLITTMVIMGILGIYYQTTWSMVETWHRSDTYAHGFLILPFSIYMIWTRRQQLMSLDHQPNFFALVILCGVGFMWLIATLASVQIITQYMLIAMIPIIVWAILGNRILIATAFPLVYLFFAVPFGDILIPPLIDFTADFTVSALQLSGIPVFREGTYFSLPTGNWSVVEACSGLRYLIASVTLGTLYAYLTYFSFKRRVIFILLSIIVPIIANGIRAYLIVMTGHLSGMTLAVGVDHLVYGWVFFGFVMLLLFWIGSYWREDDTNETKQAAAITRPNVETNNSSSLTRTMLMACAVFAITFIWPISATHLEKQTVLTESPEIKINNLTGNWSINSSPMFDWEPIYVGTPTKFYNQYQNNQHTVNLYITYYHNQQQGNELINHGNILVTETDHPWRIVDETIHTIVINSQEINIRQTQLHSHTAKQLVWQWYWLGDDETINPYVTKALLARDKLFSNNDGGAEIILASDYNNTPDEAIQIMTEFLIDMRPHILEGLHNTSDPL